MLGYNLVKSLSFFLPNDIIYFTYRGANKSVNSYKNSFAIHCELSNSFELKKILQSIKPSIIIHTAAIVNLEHCENNLETAKYMHSDIVQTFHDVCPKAKFIYISTDSIFNGVSGNYSEKSEPSPINRYATTKYWGEQTTLNLFHNSIIIRTNIFGFHFENSNSSLAEWALFNLLSNKSISGYDNIFFNPVYIGQLSQSIHLLIEKNFIGIINIGTEKFISKFEFLVILANEFNINLNLISKSFFLNENSKVARPFNTTLNTSLFNNLYDITYNIDNGINDFKKEYNLITNGKY
jgi:dTDP-4-dehydrorhamnose reductase